MAKKQTFGDKVRKQRHAGKQMAKIVAAEKKPNGQYRFKMKMVNADDVSEELKAAKNAL
jgi:hypothetical protein